MAKALVVDDESDAREFVRAVLEDEGWEVSEAVDGEEGLKQAEAVKPDLFVLDVQMPKKDGFSLFGDLVEKGLTKESKVIMLTGVGARYGIGFDAQNVGDYVGQEPDAYLEKPIDPEALKKVLKKISG